MMRSFLLAGVAAIALAASAQAAVTLSGNYVQAGVNDLGTMGSGGSTPPGMLHDPTGTADFAPGGIANDYLTPGTPHEGFSVNFTGSGGFKQNENWGIQDFFGGPSTGNASAANWTGSLPGIMTVTHNYALGANSERIVITTTLTALIDLENVTFARSVDPDPDVNRFGTFNTINKRGNATLSPEDIVGSNGAISGLFLALLNLSGDTYEHNTGIELGGGCCSNVDPETVLIGGGPIHPGTNNADDGLHMGWRIGNMAAGASATISYAYVFGDRLDDVVIDERVPEPATLAGLGLGIAGLAVARRRKRS